MLFVDLVQNVDQVRYRIVFDNSPLNGIAENSAKCRFKPPCCFGCPGFYGFQNVNYLLVGNVCYWLIAQYRENIQFQPV